MSLIDGLEQFYERALAGMEMAVVSPKTLELQNYMRTNYPWAPNNGLPIKTGTAAKTMTGSYTKDNEGFTIALSYGVNYGVYLELAHEKKYALTHPTAKAKGPEVLKEFQSLFDKINKRF